MEEDFPTSPSKRRRTIDPEGDTSAAELPIPISVPATELALPAPTKPEESRESGNTIPDGFLDVLMQQVEAESVPVEQPQAAGQSSHTSQPNLATNPPQNKPQDVNFQSQNAREVVEDHLKAETPSGLESAGPQRPKLSPPAEPSERFQEEVTIETDPKVNGAANDPSILDEQSIVNASVTTGVSNSVHEAIMMDGVEQVAAQVWSPNHTEPVQERSTKSEQEVHFTINGSFLLEQQPSALPDAPAEENPAHATAVTDVVEQLGRPEPLLDAVPPEAVATEAREWEIDSSPYESSDSDSSDTDSEDSDEDEDPEYSMLDPEEQARILMQDGGSDDEGGKSKEKGTGLVRTANERIEEVIPKPDIQVTPEMPIELLGQVEAIVESTVVLKAKTSGEYQVLESGSLLCLKDRTVVGVVAETIGRVEQPMYTIRFTNDAAIEGAGLKTSGTTVYYVPQHSTFVFTQPLKGLKGSDASNFHDEEVGDEEMEFSDDEKEADHKRQLKLKRQGRLGRDDGPRGGRGGRGRGRGRGDYNNSNLRHNSISSQPESIDHSNGALNYDDDLDDGYTPLPRPTHDLPAIPMPPPPPIHFNRGGSQPNRSRGSQRDNRGGRGRGGRGGSFDNYNRHPLPPRHQNQAQQSFNLPPHHTQFSSDLPHFFPQPQQTPHLLPQFQSPPFGASFSPSPISPLPGQQFNFAQFQGLAGMQQQQHGQDWQSAMANASAMGRVPAYGEANWGNARGGNMNANGNVNEAALAQVQRQLEELQRLRTQGGGSGGGANGGQAYEST